MPAESPLLTIAIPTYNRSRYLTRLLESLIPQLANQQRVELLISDNASTDETPVVLKQFSKNGLIFRSLRNHSNLGADGNIAQCFAEAAGTYVWIVGDDDVVLAGALEVILNLISQDEYDLIYLRGLPLIEGAPTPQATPPLKMKIKIVRDPKIFTLGTHVFLTFISGNIVNKQRVSSLPHQPFAELISTSLVQLGWIYTALAHFRKGAFILNPLVAAGVEDRGGYSLYTVFGTNLKYITTTWLNKPKLGRIILNGTVQTFFPGFVLRSRRKHGPFTNESPDTVLREVFADNMRYHFFIYPLLKLPTQAARVWWLLCRIINCLDRSVGNPMLR